MKNETISDKKSNIFFNLLIIFSIIIFSIIIYLYFYFKYLEFKKNSVIIWILSFLSFIFCLVINIYYTIKNKSKKEEFSIAIYDGISSSIIDDVDIEHELFNLLHKDQPIEHFLEQGIQKTQLFFGIDFEIFDLDSIFHNGTKQENKLKAINRINELKTQNYKTRKTPLDNWYFVYKKEKEIT